MRKERYLRLQQICMFIFAIEGRKTLFIHIMFSHKYSKLADNKFKQISDSKNSRRYMP